MTEDSVFTAHLPLYVGQLVIIVTMILCHMLVLRRIGERAGQIQRQAMDLTVKQQEIAMLIAKSLEKERQDAATAVAGLVVEQAASVRAKVEAAAQSVEGGFAAGAGIVNEKLDLLTTHGANDTNAKLDLLVHHTKDTIKGPGPVKVEVINTPLEIVPKTGRPK